MRYMLMMNSSLDGDDEYMGWPKEVLYANFAFIAEFSKKLTAPGELLDAEGLAPPPRKSSSGRARVGARSLTACFQNPRNDRWANVHLRTLEA
jgi:hypothetical protein